MVFGKNATVAVEDRDAGYVRMIYGAEGVSDKNLQSSVNQKYPGNKSRILTPHDRRPPQHHTAWRR